MFFGSYEHNLDAKGRLMVPSRIRNQAGNKLYIMKGFDGCLSLYREEDFAKKVEELSNLSFSSKDARDVSRIALASVSDIEVDKLGRIQLPTKLLSQYNIGKQVVVVGVIDHFEVWDAKAWESYTKENESLYEEKSETLVK